MNSAARIAVADIEADGLLIQAKTIHCLGVIDYQTGEEYLFEPGEIDDGVRFLNNYDIVVFHNGVMYDAPVLRRLTSTELRFEIYDTLLVSRLMYSDKESKPLFGDHSLSNWGKLLKCAKTEHTDFTQYSEEMGQYCIQDCRVLAKIYSVLSQYNEEYAESIRMEHEVAKIVSLQCQNGYTLNIPACKRLIVRATEETERVVTELQSIFSDKIVHTEQKTPQYWEDPETGTQYRIKGDAPNKIKPRLVRGPNRIKTEIIPFNPGSPQQILDRFIDERGWVPDKLSKGGKEKQRQGLDLTRYDYSTANEVLEDLPYPEAEMILNYRLYDKKRSQAKEWIDNVQPDGKIYGSVITNGAVTGRMTHNTPNLAQIPKVSKPLGKECRECFEPRPGWVQVGADASGLELRMLAHFLEPYDNGEYINVVLNGDVHTHNQKAAGLGSRDNAKTFIYGFIYGAGDSKLGTIVSGSLEEGRALRKRFLTELPALQQLIASMAEIQKGKGCIYGLDRRRLPIRKQHAALNTQLQSAGALVMKMALRIFFYLAEKHVGPHGKDWALLANVHDEFQIECKPDRADYLGKLMVRSIQLAGPKLGINCPLDGEYQIGKNWAECH